MTDRDLEHLCRACGLCCDGSLFGRVRLASDEVASARTRLRVLPNGSAFEQPCVALTMRDGDAACGIYGERPRACRAFTCRLYARHRREGGPIEARVEAVRRVRALLRVVESMEHGDARNAVVTELMQRMEDDFARAEGD